MDILDALAPLLYACQLCSLTQWRLLRSFGTDQERCLQRSRWLEFYGWTVLCASSCLTLYGLLNNYDPEEEDMASTTATDIGHMVDFIQLVGMRVAHMATLFESLWQRRSQREFYAELRQVDGLLESALHLKVGQRQQGRRICQRGAFMLGGYLLTQCFILFTKLLSPTARRGFALYWLFYLLPLLICGLRYFQIYTAVLILRQRLELLLHVLSHLQLAGPPLKTSDCARADAGSAAPAADAAASAMRRLFVARQLYQRLWTLGGLLNRCYGLSMLVLVGNDFLAITSNCYWIFLNFQQYAASPYDFLQIVGSAVWSLPHLANVLTLALVCERAAQCTTRLALSLHRIGVDLHNDCHNALITQFSLQLLHQRLQFSAAGFFNVDCTLLYTIAGATTTYLIILIQFHMSEAHIGSS